jgi:hypothetical protein
MEDIAAGVTPAMDITPAGDPYIQQLLAENARQQARIQTLERRLAHYEQVYDDIAASVQRSQGAKGVLG